MNHLGAFAANELVGKKIRIMGVKIIVNGIQPNATTNGDTAVYSTDLPFGVEYVKPTTIVHIV